MIAGEDEPDEGELRIGETVQIAYVDQARADLTPENSVWKEISGGHDTIELGNREVNLRQYVSWFNFKGSDQQKRAGDLSGGERNRVHLAKLLRSGGNLLLLDEPTNDLDVDTLRAVEDALTDLQAAPSSSPTTAGSSTVWRPISSPSRATLRPPGSRAASRSTRLGARDARRRGARAAPHHLQVLVRPGA